MSQPPDRVWYAAYGSNLSSARFLCYLQGGSPEGSARSQPGARDRTPHLESRAIGLSLPVRFGGGMSSWQHRGVAYLHMDVGETSVGVARPPGDAHPPPVSLGRMFSITREQMEDVFAQENGLEPGESDPLLESWDFDQSINRVEAPLFYNVLLGLGREDGDPIVTFTRDRPLDPPWQAPSRQYLHHIVSGLAEVYPASVWRGYVDRLLRPPSPSEGPPGFYDGDSLSGDISGFCRRYGG